MKPDSRTQKQSQLGAGAGGGLVGTLLTLYCERIPEASPYRALCFRSIPWLSVSASIGLFYARSGLESLFLYYKRCRTLRAFKKLADAALSDKSASSDHKMQILKKKEDVERAELDRLLSVYSAVKDREAEVEQTELKGL